MYVYAIFASFVCNGVSYKEADRKSCFRKQEMKNLFVWLPEDFCVQGSHVFMEDIWRVTDYEV